MKFPKSIIICGKTFSIIPDKNVDGGSFEYIKQEIKINPTFKDDAILEMLVHEILEVILAKNNHRYSIDFNDESCKNFLFSFNHFDFENICSELAYSIKQLYNI